MTQLVSPLKSYQRQRVTSPPPCRMQPMVLKRVNQFRQNTVEGHFNASALSGVQMRPRTNSGHSLSRFSVPLLRKPRDGVIRRAEALILP